MRECAHDHAALAELIVEIALAIHGHDRAGARLAHAELDRITGGDAKCATAATRTPGPGASARGRARAVGTAAV